MVGIVRIPLNGDQDPLADGRYGLCDVVAGHCAGEVSVTVWRSFPEVGEFHGEYEPKVLSR